jgi:hypothetical protein
MMVQANLGQAIGNRTMKGEGVGSMDNHYHLLLETPEPNLSRAMHWCNVSYSVWFNLRHRRSGHLLQGRFDAELVQDDVGWQEVARYVHLNPVRVARHGLDKSARAASRAGPIAAPAAELVEERLKTVRPYRWSSYPGYAGYSQPLNWVWREPLARLCGGNTDQERRAALREYTEGPARQGVVEPPRQRLVGGVVIGTVGFAEELRQQARGNPREQKPLRALTQTASWEQIVVGLERLKGERWDQFAERHGDWGAMLRSGWAAPPDDCVWPNWASWLEIWITQWSAKPFRDSNKGCGRNRSCASNWQAFNYSSPNDK